MSQKGSQGPWGHACGWGELEPPLALVHTALPFLVPLMERGTAALVKGLERGGQAQESPTWGEQGACKAG